MTEVENQSVAQALMQAMETMAFIIANPVEEAEVLPSELICTRIDFAASRSGRLELLCGRAFGEMLSGNLSADEESPPGTADERANDALKELVNVTCGLWLRQGGVSGAETAEMSVPQQLAADAAQWEATRSADAVLLDAEGHPLLIRIAEND